MRFSFSGAAPRFRVTVAAATFAELLRDSYYTRSLSLGSVINVAERAARDTDQDPEVAELVDLMRRADDLSVAYWLGE